MKEIFIVIFMCKWSKSQQNFIQMCCSHMLKQTNNILTNIFFNNTEQTISSTSTEGFLCSLKLKKKQT